MHFVISVWRGKYETTVVVILILPQPQREGARGAKSKMLNMTNRVNSNGAIAAVK